MRLTYIPHVEDGYALIKMGATLGRTGIYPRTFRGATVSCR